jgi:hypothetical protein
VDDVTKIVNCDDFIGDVLEVKTYGIFGAIQWGIQVKVFNVNAHELGTGGR